jgi:hypothetical protein
MDVILLCFAMAVLAADVIFLHVRVGDSEKSLGREVGQKKAKKPVKKKGKK